MKGFLINIEGNDGSGKHTQAELLYKKLEREGRQTKLLSFPRYGQPSCFMVEQYLAGTFGSDPSKINPYEASLFYAIDRYESFIGDWQSFYQNGCVLIADRYTNSNAAYQGGKLEPAKREEYLNWLYDLEYNKLGLPVPDVVIYLYADPMVSARLRAEREAKTHTHADIHERDNGYLIKCQNASLEIARAQGWHIIFCTTENGEMRAAEDIHEEIYQIIRSNATF